MTATSSLRLIAALRSHRDPSETDTIAAVITGATVPEMSVSEDVELFWGVARRVSDAVRAALDSTSDWAESGGRQGQYRVDLVLDEICVQLLLEAGFAVLSEESGISGADRNRIVVLDPLDGSTNAARGLAWFATAMCLVDDQGPLAAWVINHGNGDLFTAQRDHGARRNGHLLSVNPPVDLSHAFIGVSGLAGFHYGWAQFRALGAAALDISAVASGVFDAWCDMSVDAHGVWDYLAAVLICTEAGGVAVDALGRNLLVLDPAERRTPVVACDQALLAAICAERTRAQAGKPAR
jgi:fructose-1,6-bisphosphatase/inositol monophosphatase family enzyme